MTSLQRDKSAQIDQATSVSAGQKQKLWKKFGAWVLVAMIGGTALAISQNWGIHLFGSDGTAALAKKRSASVEFEYASPFVDRAVYGNDLTRKYWNVQLFQVQIRNRARFPLHAQHVKLTDLRQWDGKSFQPWDAEPVVLQWPARISKDIPPGDAVLVPFARIYPPDLQRELREDKLYSGDVAVPQLRFTVDGWPRRMRSDVPPGIHRFKITAFFTNSVPAEVELELKWPEGRRESVESMAQEIRVGRAK